MKKLVLFLLLVIVPLKTYALTDTAKSTIAMDMDSGRILYEKNANEQRLIASITKIMTATVAIENGNLNKEITIGEINLLLFDEIKEPIKVDVKTRYSSKVAKAMIIQNGDCIKMVHCYLVVIYLLNLIL